MCVSLDRDPSFAVQQPSLDIVVEKDVSMNKLMCQCFPKLFPFGRCGQLEAFKDSRQCQAAEFRHYLLRFHDRRFSKDSYFVFWLLSYYLRRNARYAVAVAAAHQAGRDLRSVSCGDFRRLSNVNAARARGDCVRSEDEAEYRELFRQISSFSRGLPGTSMYMSSVRRDLLGMTSSPHLFHPTVFLTLSANDLWPHVAKMCLRAPSVGDVTSLTSTERLQEVRGDRFWSVVHFRDRLESLFSHIINGVTKPLGNVVAFFKRIEFQDRGAPHLHAILWVDEMKNIQEDVLTEEGLDRVIDYVDSTVCATLDPARWATHPLARCPVSYGREDMVREFERGISGVDRKVCRKRGRTEFAVSRSRSSRRRFARETFAPTFTLDDDAVDDYDDGEDVDPIATQPEPSPISRIPRLAVNDSVKNTTAIATGDSESSSEDEAEGSYAADMSRLMDRPYNSLDLFDPLMIGGKYVCVPLWHPLMQRRVALLGERVQMHKCTFTCWKKTKKAKTKRKMAKKMSKKERMDRDVQACRFRFPREARNSTYLEFDNSNVHRPKLTVQPKQDLPFFNTCNPFISSVWSANMDNRLIGNSYATIKYTCSYIVKNDDPDQDSMGESVVRRLRELRDKGKSGVYDRLMATAMGDIGYQEFCLEQAFWILMGWKPDYASHEIVVVDVSRADQPAKQVSVKSADTMANADDDESIVCDGISSKRGRILSYMQRPRTPYLGVGQPPGKVFSSVRVHSRCTRRGRRF